MSTGVNSQFRNFSPTENLEVGKRLHQVFAGSGAYSFGPARGLLIGSGGLANGFDATSTFFGDAPLQTGWNPLGTQEISSGTAAADIWAVY